MRIALLATLLLSIASLVVPTGIAPEVSGPWDDDCERTVDAMCRDEWSTFWNYRCVVYVNVGDTHDPDVNALGVCIHRPRLP